jgi:hypothetical protein
MSWIKHGEYTKYSYYLLYHNEEKQEHPYCLKFKIDFGSLSPEQIVDGYIKSDDCMNLLFDGNPHFCDFQRFKEFSEVIEILYKIASEWYY